eukprot:GILI01001281.1.p1 GENE.GILI01001281.1~~GILI01001281.1.p1  ORF type:complete len:232 (-),score=84.53 GILI01001281.1:401-1096(-)
MLARRLALAASAVSRSPCKQAFVPAVAKRFASTDATTAAPDSTFFPKGSYDNNFEKYRVKDVDAEDARNFAYFTVGGARFVYASLGRVAVIKFVASLSAAADVLALSTIEVDLTPVQPGQNITVKWRGKPIFVRHRTAEEIAAEKAVNVADLRHPEADEQRVQKPEWLVVLGVCTHLGCVPVANAGDFGGYFCPCHGSHYDFSGRIRKGPAPLNLELPPYQFVEENKILIG